MSLGDMAGPISICYAAEHPDKVSHLILNSSYLRGADLAPPERRNALVDYVANFGYPTFNLLGDPAIDMGQQLGVMEINEQAASHQSQAEILKTYFAADVSAYIGRVHVSTLVLHALGDPLVPLECGVEVAERAPSAEFVTYERASAVPWVISNVLVSEVHRFLGIPARNQPAPGGTESDIRAPTGSLTARETQVLTMLAGGMSNNAIASELVLSVRTVERHIANIYSKLRLNSRVQATAYAMEQGLVSAHEALRSSRRMTSPAIG
jgi:DNA-binding CsgD family transcriptional regulator